MRQSRSLSTFSRIISGPAIVLTKTEVSRLNGLPTVWYGGANAHIGNGPISAGSSLQRTRKDALAIASAEAVERAFMNTLEPLQLPSFAGRSVHGDLRFAREHAYCEWVERATITDFARRGINITSLQNQEIPIDLRLWFRLHRFEIKSIQLAAEPAVVLVAAIRSDQRGVVFGSAASTTSANAHRRALWEAFRMAYFIPYFETATERTPFITQLLSWYSAEGFARFNEYCGRSSNVVTTQLPKFSAEEKHYSETEILQFGWFCSYWDPSVPLSEPYCSDTPIH